MSIETSPVEITDSKTERNIDHYVCCEIPNGWYGMTKAFCGEIVMFEGRDRNTGDPCPICVEAGRQVGCPLKGPAECTPIR